MHVYIYLYTHPHTLALCHGPLRLVSMEMNSCFHSCNTHDRNPSWCCEQMNQQQLSVTLPLHLAQLREAADSSSYTIYTLLYRGHEGLLCTCSASKQSLGTAGDLRLPFQAFEQNWGEILVLVETICSTKPQKGGAQGRAGGNTPW